jgi:hypothetical protein
MARVATTTVATDAEASQNEARSSTGSFGDNGYRGLFGRPRELAREHCAVRFGAAGGFHRPGSAAIDASAGPKRF